MSQKYKLYDCEIISKQKLTSTIYDFIVKNRELSEISKSGQFANIFVPSKTLRRPISICDIDKQNSTLRFVFEVRGEGTDILSKFEQGQSLNLLAPLGNGWKIQNISEKVMLVGGGIGVPPLISLAKIHAKNATVIVGFRNKDNTILIDDLESFGAEVLVATDDGTLGHHGFVTDIVKSQLEQHLFDKIYACGPSQMLKAVAKLGEKTKIPVQISTEERMGCGIGACLVCACKTKKSDGTETYSHVCKDGPVFDSKEVLW